MQVGFIVLLLVCAAQLAFWMFDEVRYTADVTQRLRDAYTALGSTPDVLEQLNRDRWHRLNRYAWEGAFFLAVLLAAMGVVYKALREEAELRRRQEQFLAAVSHEFKSPLASLRLSVETLALRDPGATERAELVRRILVELGRLERMVANTLDTSRLASGGSAAPERVTLIEVTTEMLDELHEFAAECGVRVLPEIDPALTVHADRDGVRTVVRNLVHNAIKASPRGGEVHVRGTTEGEDVVLEVRDHGVGFPPREAARLFEQFYRVEGDGRGRMQGTGLGLYLVERLTRSAGGRVEATSAGTGAGATFTVRWPRVTEIA
jgi:two-component system, OmpR family, phosphate regulon sensor histidine kinase PhoR